MFKALVSRGSKALQRLDERLNDEGEEPEFDEEALPRISVEQWRQASRGFPSKTAEGMDGFHVTHLQHLGDQRAPEPNASESPTPVAGFLRQRP